MTADDELPDPIGDPGVRAAELADEAELADAALSERLRRLRPFPPIGDALTSVNAAASRRRLRNRSMWAAAAVVVLVILASAAAAATRRGGDESVVVADGPTSTSADPGDGSVVPTGVPGTGDVPGTTPGTPLPGTLPLAGTAVPRIDPTLAPQPSSTSTSSAPAGPGRIQVEIKPRASSVVVGERILVDVEVRNTGGRAVAFRDWTCNSPVRMMAAPIANPAMAYDTGVNAITGQGATMAVLVDRVNVFGGFWVLPVEALADVPARGCTTALRSRDVAPGTASRFTYALDAHVLPGPLPNNGSVVLSGSVAQQPAADSPEGAEVEAQPVSIKLVEDGRRAGSDLGSVYSAIDANAQVRAFLDGEPGAPERPFLVDFSYLSGAWQADLIPVCCGSDAFSARLRVRSDPVTGRVLTVQPVRTG